MLKHNKVALKFILTNKTIITIAFLSFMQAFSKFKFKIKCFCNLVVMCSL
ncbi:hypothetical protein FKM82_012074 [Ascaphus truei]